MVSQNVSTADQAPILQILETRFNTNMSRHPDLVWEDVSQKLSAHPQKIQSLLLMEETGGEPDVVGYDSATDAYIFCDCSVESPSGRRSLCYDRAGLDARKKFKPQNTAVGVANAMGIELLTQEQYINLHQLGTFDTKTSTWLKTPDAIRKLGGAIFGDYRYDTVFIYHNGAQSYYASRGFRGRLVV